MSCCCVTLGLVIFVNVISITLTICVLKGFEMNF